MPTPVRMASPGVLDLAAVALHLARTLVSV